MNILMRRRSIGRRTFRRDVSMDWKVGVLGATAQRSVGRGLRRWRTAEFWRRSVAGAPIDISFRKRASFDWDSRAFVIGTHEQKQKMVAKLVTGEQLAHLPFTEKEAGSTRPCANDGDAER